MKKLALIALLVAACVTARAEWRDLKAGINAKTASELVGPPLMQTKARGGLFVTWTFDYGGYILFERGLVSYWQAPTRIELPRGTMLASASQGSSIKAGIDAKTASAYVGLPLMETKARGGRFVTWTFDHGGYIIFENGRVRYWQALRPIALPRGAMVATAAPQR